MRFSEIAAIHLHSFNKVLISGSHTQWKLIHLNPDFLVVVLNSVVHRCKHNKIVMFVQCIDSAIPGRYTVQAPHKAGAGRGNPEFNIEHNRAHAVFSCHEHCYAQIMVGRAGPVSAGPGSMLTGISTPVRLTTYKVVESLGGEFIEFNIEAATMATVPTLAQPEIRIINGQAVTSSLAVADYFIKRHADVIRKIESLECSTLFRKRNFAFTSISVNQPNGGTRKLPCYQITRDGFAFLAMGFTGKRAAQFKEAYINAFNQMEKQLSKPSVLSDAAHNASVLYSYISSIHQVWLQQLYPMLEKAESPLAVSLYDRINDAAALASLINMTLNRSEVRGRK
ncbi:TPA: Rha family transcriptional regulator [Salmonella enterica]